MNLQHLSDEILIIDIPFPNSSEQVYTWKNIKMCDKSTVKKDLSLSKVNYVPKAKDKLYFYPGCNVPRYKVRNWCKKNGSTITVKEDKSTVRFVSDSSIDKCFDYGIYMQIDKYEFINWLNANKYEQSAGYIELTSLIKNSASKYVYMLQYGNNMHHLERTIDKWTKMPSKGAQKGLITGWGNHPDFLVTNYYRTSIITEKNLEILKSFTRNVSTYDQEDIIGIINEDAVTIDKTMHARLKDMLGNNNKSDHVVALEVIANCNINPSLHYVLLLLREFGDTIILLKESKHVNFKSLLEYIGISRSGMCYLNEDRIVNILLEKDVLTMDNVTELAGEIKTFMADRANTEHFILSKITVSEEIQEYLKNKQVQKEPVIN